MATVKLRKPTVVSVDKYVVRRSRLENMMYNNYYNK